MYWLKNLFWNCLCCLPLWVQSQPVNFEKISIDDWVAFDFPAPYEIIDTFYLSIYTAKLPEQTILFTKMGAKEHKKNTLKQLKKGYDLFRDGLLKTAPQAILTSDQFIRVHGILGKKITYDGVLYEVPIEGEVFVFFIRGSTYCFQNILLKERTEPPPVAIDMLINAIDFHGLKLKDQL